MPAVEEERGAESETRRHEDERERVNGEVRSYGAGLTQQAAEDMAATGEMAERLGAKRSDGDVPE